MKLSKAEQTLLDTLAFMSSGAIVATAPRCVALQKLIAHGLISTAPALVLRGHTLVGNALLVRLTAAGMVRAKEL